MSDWKSYINANGDFELPNFLYKSINELMKQALDIPSVNLWKHMDIIKFENDFLKGLVF